MHTYNYIVTKNSAVSIFYSLLYSNPLWVIQKAYHKCVPGTTVERGLPQLLGSSLCPVEVLWSSLHTPALLRHTRISAPQNIGQNPGEAVLRSSRKNSEPEARDLGSCPGAGALGKSRALSEPVCLSVQCGENSWFCLSPRIIGAFKGSHPWKVWVSTVLALHLGTRVQIPSLPFLPERP